MKAEGLPFVQDSLQDLKVIKVIGRFAHRLIPLLLLFCPRLRPCPPERRSPPWC